MAKTLRPVVNPNKVFFIFQGYITKLIHSKRDGEIEKLIAIEVSTGPSKLGRVRLSLTRFMDDLSVLEEGKAYGFNVYVTTGRTSQLDFKHLAFVTNLKDEPVKGLKNKLVGRIKEIYPTVVDSLYVVDFACKSDNENIKEETYRCRLKITNKEQLAFLKDGLWNVEIEFKQSPWILSWYDEKETCFAVEEEVEDYWIKQRDENGNIIMVKDEYGVEKPKMTKVFSKTFIEMLEITPLSPFEPK